MLIASRIQRPKAPIELGNGDGKPSTKYFFRPVEPDNPLSEHVAEITNKTHIAQLLKIDHCYYIADANPEDIDRSVLAKPEVSKPKPTVKDAADEALTDSGETKDELSGQVIEGTGPMPGEEPTATTPSVDNLLKLPIKEFKSAIKGADKSTLKQALATEQAKSDAEQRPTVIKALESELKAA